MMPTSMERKVEELGFRLRLDPHLQEALHRLDRWLLRICDEEERRARLLAGNGMSGWDGVRNLLRPETSQLVFFEYPEEANLLPAGDHVFNRIGQTLALEPCEAEALLVVFAAHFEPRYQSLYAVLQDNLNQSRPTERLLLSVLGRTSARRKVLVASLADSGRLHRSGFLATDSGTYPPLGRPFSLPAEMVPVILGAAAPVLAGPTAQQWLNGTGSQPNTVSWQVIHGVGDRAGLARNLCGPEDRLFWAVLPATLREALPAAQAAWRLGIALAALPLLDLSALDEPDRASLGHSLEALTRTVGGAVWLLSEEPLPLAAPHLECQPLTWSGRRQIWLDEAVRQGVGLSPEDASRLASRYRFTPAEIRQVFEAAPGVDAPALERTARHMGHTIVRHSLRTAIQRGFDDLVLRRSTREALDRLVYFVEHRDRVAEQMDLQRRYQLQRGPIVLFSGRSGTGKTLAAEAVAGKLGRPLHTVDIARLVSKYIGDTEKHVDEILNQGERASSVLFFDEADVLFSSRIEKTSNASEHFANMVVGYLLQRIERHDGVVILATNLRHAIDEAFLRRFHFRIEFPMPEAEERWCIWKLMLPATVACQPDIDLDSIALTHRLVGGEIRNAALKAIFLAEREGSPLGQAHLEKAIALELLELGRISRQPAKEPRDPAPSPDRGQLLRACVEFVQDIIENHLRPRFLKEIHIVHGSPTEDTLTGKRPAISVALFRLAGKRGNTGLRAGFVISAWSHRAEEEYELLGVVHEALFQTSLNRRELLGHPLTMRLQESHDFDLLHRFWSSHDHPVRASLVIDLEMD